MLNKNGFTIAEVIVSFSMITVILASIVTSTIYYRDKVKKEEVLTQLTDFKNMVTKTIYDDIIRNDNHKLVSADTCIGTANCIVFMDKSGNSHVLRIIEIDTSTDINSRGVYLSYDEVKYMLPDSDLGIGEARICDFIGGFRIDDYEEGGTHLYTIKTAFKHKDLNREFNIMLTIDSLKDNVTESPNPLEDDGGGNLLIEGSLTASSSVTANSRVSVSATCTTLNSGCSFSYRWYVNNRNSTTGGTLISGATSSTFTPDCSYVNKYLYAVATASASGYQDTEITMSSAIKVHYELYAFSCRATLSGTPKVGNIVIVTGVTCGNNEMTSWDIDEYTFASGYRWQTYYNVQRSSSNQYTIPSSDVGKIILASITFKNVVDAPGHCYGGSAYASLCAYNTNPVTE